MASVGDNIVIPTDWPPLGTEDIPATHFGRGFVDFSANSTAGKS